MIRNFVALDLGAESGRAILGVLEQRRLLLEELHRFPNQPVRLPTGLYWDTLRLWHEILQGLAVAGRDRGLNLDGIGVDTWGVDIAMLGSDGALVDNPRHYRDSRNEGIPERVFEVVPRAEVFAQTGLQVMQINSLYQWYAMKLAWTPAIDTARTLFFMPDLFHYFLTGVRKAERSIASTSQFYNPRFGRWASEMLLALRLNPDILPDIVDSGTRLGPILPWVADLTGLSPDTPVFAAAGHDTASAVAAVPASEHGGWCYVSSGTWSLMGVEIADPVLTPECLALNFTNEIGVERRVRLLKNIMGMWPLQECRRAWAIEGHDYSYDTLTGMAASSPPFAALLDPDAFLEPGHMPERIAAYCRDTGQQPPDGPGAVTRAILESLALRYRQVVENLESLTRTPITRIHIVGGGSRNRLLNQFVADCTGRAVIAGPTEATAAGNVLVQAMGAGFVSGLAEIRDIVARSFPVTRFDPTPGSSWDAHYATFRKLCGN
jgi:rhamnulokinase